MEYSDLWLDYGTVDFEPSRIEQIYYDSKDRCVLNAVQELKMFCRAGGGDPSAEYRDNTDGLKGVILSCGDERGDYYDIEWQSYRLEEKNGRLVISSQSSCGVLWGVFDLIRRIRCGEKLNGLNATCVPDNPFRMLNHWDNDDGSVERGYSGNSFFFKDGEIIVNERIKAYARFLASVGINAIVINNVNVKDNAVYFITERYFDRLNELTELFAEYGVRLFLSVDYAASIDIGGLDSADPCSAEVIAWWEEKCAEIYRNIHGLGGFLIKADSEGRPGPFTYGRNQAQGANMLARALQPYGGIVIWRCFVYNCNQDWRDRKTDRARAAYDYFSRLDGQFDDNVILQIKNGPVDFQVREPVSPLLGAMRKTNQMIEFQIAQEYTGQQIDLCYLIPWFKEVLDFRMYLNDSNDTVADYISGRAYGGKLCGCAAVTNTGNDFNWTGHDLAAANLYGFGRLCFDSSLSAELIAKEWIVQTFGRSAQVIRVISEMLMKSWQVYEKYTAPLGIGWMVRREDHYGVDVDAYEYSRWGTYHYADRDGIGVDRTNSGTGYVNQYSEVLAKMYTDLKTCPDNLILFFHHLPYTHKLKSGKTIIQHIYDSHFEGAEGVLHMIRKWDTLKAYMPHDVFRRTAQRLHMQLENAIEWRDTINSYFYRKSGIGDNKNRTIY